MKKQRITALIQNQNGILTRLMGLFAKHQFQIENLTVGYTELEGVSKMTVIVEAKDNHKFLQLLKQINKQIEVLFVTDLTDQQVIEEELALIKELTDIKTFESKK
ncbi:acetolactate synthase small subunit [Lysinibacillus sp. K60]|uniref:acetolactate synthase small subunit n=1 Tax=Lysinibacillus sp. K60 TaxID=2720027 RepID=UPI001C8C3A34|nr:acetolactate synthase small subunit [Lysinibacillus sp. K60]MBX8946769.1 acetolactate synthase small subunit [Lysinibacillus sp. K60]